MGYIYFLKSDIDGHITYKIGKTSRKPTKRLSELATGNAGILSIEELFETNNYNTLEKILHNNFKMYHIKGEWFNENLTKQLFLHSCKVWDLKISQLREMGNPFI